MCTRWSKRCRIADFDFSPFSEHLATAGEDARIRLWPLAADIYKARALPVDLTLSHTGSADFPDQGSDNLRTPLFELSGHSRKVTQLAWHPNASGVLLSAATDNTMRVWDVEAKEAKLTFKGAHQHTTPVNTHTHNILRTQMRHDTYYTTHHISQFRRAHRTHTHTTQTYNSSSNLTLPQM